MRIGFDAKRLFHNRSGLGQYSRFVVSNLHRYHSDLELFLFAQRSTKLFDVPRGGSFWKLPFPANYRRSVDMRSQWMRSGIEIYHGLSNELPRRSSAMIKTVVTIHDLLFQDFPEDYPWLDRKIYDAKVRSAIDKSHHIVAISQATASDILDRYSLDRNKVSVIYQSCADHFYEEIPIPQRQRTLEEHGLLKPFVLCVSSFSSRKNQIRLLHAFYQSALYKDYDLVLVGGESEYKQKVREVAKQLGLLKNIKMPTVLANEDVAAIYQGSEVVVYPSLKEGFGIPVVEGMASQKPVITSANTSCAEAGGAAVLTFNAENVNQLTTVLLQVINDRTLQRSMIEKGMVRLSELSPQKETQKLVDIYTQLASL